MVRKSATYCLEFLVDIWQIFRCIRSCV